MLGNGSLLGSAGASASQLGEHLIALLQEWLEERMLQRLSRCQSLGGIKLEQFLRD
jgi:hypothetical protein